MLHIGEGQISAELQCAKHTLVELQMINHTTENMIHWKNIMWFVNWFRGISQYMCNAYTLLLNAANGSRLFS